LSKDIEASHYENKFIPRFVSVPVEGKSTKRYHNTTGMLIKLGKCARLLLDYVVETMDENNYIGNNHLFKAGFNKIITSAGQKLSLIHI